MKNMKVNKAVLKLMGKAIRKEIAVMCKANASILQEHSARAMQTFNWDTLINEMKEKAPTLLYLLQSAIESKQCKTSHAKRRKKSYRLPDNTNIGVSAAILLRHKNHKMNLVQRLISVIMYCGHTNTQVVKNINVIV